jgi:hypothetical protein
VRESPVISEQTKLTSKQMKKAETQKVWQRLTFGTNSMIDTISIRRERNLADQTLKKGGPHDEEFFKCFIAYLDEAIS